MKALRDILQKISVFLKDRGVRPKELLIWFIIAAVITSAGICYGSISSRDDQVFPVYISEVLASNTGYPNSDGRCSDFIEIHNAADYPIDISGFQLGDIAGKTRYIFPSGTVLQADEYYLIYCDRSFNGDGYAPFDISRAGGESFYLIARNKAVVDSVITVATDIDQSMTILEDGTQSLSFSVTPGKANSGEITNDNNIHNPSVSSLKITEFTTANTAYLSGHGILCDWVEIYNDSDSLIDISGYILSDNIGNDKYVFPAGSSIGGREYITVYCSNSVDSPEIAPFGLSRNETELLVLKNSEGMIIEIIRNVLPFNGTMALSPEGDWILTDTPSPGYENSADGSKQFMQDIGAEKGSIRISELMAAQQYILSDQNGEFSDWVELYNSSDRSINLGGWSLSDDPNDIAKWTFPEVSIDPDEYLVVFCSGNGNNDPGQLHADFALAAAGESLILSSSAGTIVDAVEYTNAQAHTSVIFENSSQSRNSPLPSPAYPNTDEGYEAFCSSSVPVGSLAIWEVMTSNDKYLPQRLGECFDWVELKNVSDHAINLSDYYISDDCDVPDMFALPDISLAPGKSHIIILTTDSSMVSDDFHHAAMNLDAQEDQLFIYDKNKILSDYVYLSDIPRGFSFGRSSENGGFTYMTPTPVNPNNAGQRLISSEPASSYMPGVYSSEDAFTVELSAAGDIYYTTDGSVPSAASAKYSDPLSFGKTTVLRAVSIESGKLPSDIYTATFIVGDKHDLPVVSLVTAPENLWGYHGIYKNNDISVKEKRVSANVSYCGSDGSFSLDCSLNLHGATTVVFFEKKTFAVRFYDSYDGPLHYDVFEDGEVTSFSSLIIRNSIESSFSTHMHDAMIGYIASQCSDRVISQKYKYVSLYLNGEYWGLYAIRERHSPEHFASYMNVPADEVQVSRYFTSVRNELYDLYKFIETHSLRSDENYEYAKSVLDIESFIDWIIFEAYMANVDINANTRYYKNPSTGLWQSGLADLDLGIVGSYAAFNEVAKTFHHGEMVSALMENEQFQDALAKRLAQLLAEDLSDENVLALIDEMADTIRSEMVWEEMRWETPVYGWEFMVDYMRDFCDGRAKQMIDSLCTQLHFTPEQREAYFGSLE